MNLSGLFGDDTFSVTPVGLVGVTTINVQGGDPTASDKLIVTATIGNHVIGYNPSSTLGSGSVTITGSPTVNFATTEHVTIDGNGGTDRLTITNPAPSRDTFTPGAAPDSGTVAIAQLGLGTSLVPLEFMHIGAMAA